MGEVIEINIISQKRTIIKKLMEFISILKKGKSVDRTIEIMDNWEYENVFECDGLEHIDQYLDDKIVCITEKLLLGVTGISSEHVEDVYNFCVWYNPKCDISNVEYTHFIRDFIEYLSSNMLNDEIKLCAIGKETIFRYAENLYKMVDMSHNINIWILDKNIYQEECFDKYKIYSLENYSYDIGSVVIIL